MSVEYSSTKRSGRRTGFLVCNTEGCNAKSASYPAVTAAPELDVAEAAHAAEGWSYSIGFFTMMTGQPVTYCPACVAGEVRP